MYIPDCNVASGILETKMKETFIVYIGQSTLRGEEACLTVGISKDGKRRQYLKHMIIQHVLKTPIFKTYDNPTRFTC